MSIKKTFVWKKILNNNKNTNTYNCNLAAIAIYVWINAYIPPICESVYMHNAQTVEKTKKKTNSFDPIRIPPKCLNGFETTNDQP